MEKIILSQMVVEALENLKAIDIAVLDVRDLTSITDTMIVASGTSSRHVKSLADQVVEKVRVGGFKPLGMEGQGEGEWVLVDLEEVILHVMLPRIRDFYNLEKLWDISAQHRKVLPLQS